MMESNKIHPEMESLLTYAMNRVISVQCLSAISEEHLGELSGGHGLFRPAEPRDWEPVWGAVGGRGGGPLVEGELTPDLYKVKFWGVSKSEVELRFMSPAEKELSPSEHPRESLHATELSVKHR